MQGTLRMGWQKTLTKKWALSLHWQDVYKSHLKNVLLQGLTVSGHIALTVRRGRENGRGCGLVFSSLSPFMQSKILAYRRCSPQLGWVFPLHLRQPRKPLTGIPPSRLFVLYVVLEPIKLIVSVSHYRTREDVSQRIYIYICMYVRTHTQRAVSTPVPIVSCHETHAVQNHQGPLVPT